MNPTLTKNYVAEGAIARYRIVKFGSADGQVLQGAAVSDALMGVVDLPSDVAAAANDRVDVVLAGIAFVEASGVIALGAPVTSNASGQATAAAPAVGTNNRIIGFAAQAAVAGDVIPVHLAPGQIQG